MRLNTNTSNTQRNQAGENSDPFKDIQRRAKDPGNSQDSTCGPFANKNSGSARTRRDAQGLTPHEVPAVENLSGQAQGSQRFVQELVSMQYTQSASGDHPHGSTPAPALALQTLESANVQAPSSTDGSASDTVVHPEGRDFKRTFRMVIHLTGDRNALVAQRVSCLDTCADLDVISHEVVESLRLKKDRYQGASVHPLGGFFKPEWQVTFDWHVAGFHKTYTSTFAVLDAKHSGDFDVLLGRATIKDIGFYVTNGKVWMISADEETQPLQLPTTSQSSVQHRFV
ncbi:MAG: hypothetical protein Q9208_005228 [Pyrenodesmia sp. 3 TL-2023]